MSSRRRHRKALPTEAVSLEIESLNHEGRGVTRIDGKVGFVDGALAGEKVMAKYVRRRSSLDELSTIEVIEASAARVEPGCEYFGRCGGCSLRHLRSDLQVDLKESVLLDHLRHATGLEPNEFELLSQLRGDTDHYRKKARLAIRVVKKKGGALVGFREKYSSFITDMQDCQILDSTVAGLIPRLREFIMRLEGAMEIPQIEVAVGEVADSNQADAPDPVVASEVQAVALIFRHLKPLSESDTAALIEFAQQQAFQLYLQPAGPDSVHKLWPEGEERLSYFLPEFHLQLKFHPQDFTQVNSSINRQIVSRAISMLQLQAGDAMLDLFCGLGNFTLAAAKHCAQIVGVEGSAAMVDRGYENARLNGIDNAQFFAADLTNPIIDKEWAQRKFDKVLLDPPRSGALEIMTQVAALNAARIVYVSCNPATLARDSAVLIESGYELKSAGVMDMFPHTTHVESIALFEKT
ncbi:MAG: 23S rRNA (uracil(1939)-C(5))-methyltransferase RlmD [Proteobacteria bacterium]|nr:23S rRNA (uracil(1939)-C(5))-methyltransferase RlmD [Pseudomonadota bacterium]